MRDLLPYFKSLADDNRIHILKLLLEKEHCVADLQEKLGLSQATVSHHLKILRQAGLLTVRTSGTWTYYAIDRQGFSVFSHLMEENFLRPIAEGADKEVGETVNGYEGFKLRILHRLLPLGAVFTVLIGTILRTKLPALPSYLQELTFRGVNMPLVFLLFLLTWTVLIQLDFSKVRNEAADMKIFLGNIATSWLLKPLLLVLLGGGIFALFKLNLLNPTDGRTAGYAIGLILLGLAPGLSLALSWPYSARLNMNNSLAMAAMNLVIVFVLLMPWGNYLFGLVGIPVLQTRILGFLLFLGLALLASRLSRLILIRSRGQDWFVEVFKRNMNICTLIFLYVCLFLLVLLQELQFRSAINYLLAVILTLICTGVSATIIFYLGNKIWGLDVEVTAPMMLLVGRPNYELMLPMLVILFGLSEGALVVGLAAVILEVPLMVLMLRLFNSLRRKLPAAN